MSAPADEHEGALPRDFLLGRVLAEVRASTLEMRSFRIEMEERMDRLEAALNDRVAPLEKLLDRSKLVLYTVGVVTVIVLVLAGLGAKDGVRMLWKMAGLPGVS